MFDEPQAKRVRREDLTSNSGSSSPHSQEHEAAVQVRFGELFSTGETRPFSGSSGVSHDDMSIAVPNTANEDAFEFRLFAAPKGDKAPLQSHEPSRIVIRSPSPAQGAPGFLIAPRPHSYYFTDAPSRAELEKLKAAAISGEDVLQESRRQWPGCALPWRLVTLTVSGKGVSENLPASSTQLKRSSDRRKKDGKKRRIAIRKKAVAVKSRQEQEAVAKLAKEAAEKAKCTQRNREKKVKKKARDKAKKSSTSSLSRELPSVADTGKSSI